MDAVDRALAHWLETPWEPAAERHHFEQCEAPLIELEFHGGSCSSALNRPWKKIDKVRRLERFYGRVASRFSSLEGRIHHVLAEANPLSGAPAPVFAHGTPPGRAVIPLPNYHSIDRGLLERLEKQVSRARPLAPHWEDRESICHFRAANGGVPHRVEVCERSLRHPEHLDARLARVDAERHRKYYGRRPAVAETLFSEFTPISEQLCFRYLLDVSGWGASYWKLLSGSVLFRLEEPDLFYLTWFDHFMRPYEHFVPCTLDDLVQQVEWARANDARCREIAERGAKLAAEAFGYEAALRFAGELLTRYFARRRELA